MPREEDVLRRWIGAVQKLDVEEGEVDVSALEAVARELGLPDDIVAQADARATVLVGEARHHIAAQRKHDAVRCLVEAEALAPWSSEVRELLEVARKPSSGGRGVLVFGGVAVLLGLLALFMFVRAPVEQVVDPVVTPTNKAAPSKAALPVRVEGILPTGATLVFEPIVQTYPSQGAWNVHGGLAVYAGSEALSEVSVTAVLFDADGEIERKGIELIGEREPAVYPGERTVESLLVYSETARIPTELQLKIERARTVPGLAVQGELHPLSGVPSGISLEMRTRSGGCEKSAMAQSTFCDLVYVLENTGPSAISELKLRAMVGEEELVTWVISSREPPLAPGERQAARFVKMLKGPPPTGDIVVGVLRVRVP